jgi:uncharacterized phage protein gp47/JayE
MSFAAQPYELFADDLLTALTGGMSREEHQFVGVEEPYSLGTPGAIPSTVKVTGQRNETVIVFEGGVDYDYDIAAENVRWRTSGRLPDDRSYFYINYYVVEAPRRLTDRNPGSVTTTLAEAFARELAVLHQQMEQIYASAFVDSAVGSSLDHVAALLALTRKDAKFAGGEVLFKRSTPADGDITIPSGTSLSDSDGRAFETTDKRTLRKGQLSVTAPIRAQAAGVAGRVEKGVIANINRPIFGIETATNEAPTFFTSAKETDEELRRRIRGALERAGKSTTNAIKFSLIEDIPGINEGNVQVTENASVPGSVEVKFALRGEVDADLVRRVEETIFNSRPAGVRVTHNLPTGSSGSTQVPALTRAEALELFDRHDQPAGTMVVGADDLATMPEGLMPLEVEVLLRLTEPNLSAAQKEAIEDEVRTAIVDFIDDLAMGADVVYSKLLGRVVEAGDVSDAALIVRVLRLGDEPLPAVGQNVSTSNRKATISPYNVFVGLMEEPVILDVLVQIQTVDVNDRATATVTQAMDGNVAAAVRAVLEEGEAVLTRQSIDTAVRSAVTATDAAMTLADAHGVVLNAQFEATGRLLYDAELVRLDDNQRFALRGVVVRLREDGNG